MIRPFSCPEIVLRGEAPIQYSFCLRVAVEEVGFVRVRRGGILVVLCNLIISGALSLVAVGKKGGQAAVRIRLQSYPVKQQYYHSH